MVNGIRVKVCGLTSLVDADFADACGADYLGFILHPKSPRYVSLENFKSMAARLPPRKKVAVVVEPSSDELKALPDAGFDIVQLHFAHDLPFFHVVEWAHAVPAGTLWLAPRVPTGKELDPAFLPLAETVLFDTYHPDRFGGSGQTGDWTAFSHLQEKYTRVSWVLAGGLKPDNIRAAISATHARIVDVNSGVEASPGVKDHAKLRAFFDALRG